MNSPAKANGHADPTNDEWVRNAPISVFKGQFANMERALAEDEAAAEAEAEQRRQEAMQRAQATAEREYRDSLFVRTEHYREDGPPDDLAVDTASLSPTRAELVRFAAWVEHTPQELAKLEQAREAFLDQLGAPAVMQTELDAIEAQDRSGMLAWLRRGASKADRPLIDEFRRQAAQQKLNEATYSAAVARDSLAALEDEIDTLREAVRVLEGRHARYAEAVLVAEIGGDLIAEYASVCARQQELVTQLAGLSRAARTQQVSYGPLREADMRLPAFGAVQPCLTIDLARLDRAVSPWRKLADRLVADPYADLSQEN